MTNSELLKRRISESGYKMEYIAQKMGITRQSLTKKVKNESSFDQFEIQAMCNVLGIVSLEEKEQIFFAQCVS